MKIIKPEKRSPSHGRYNNHVNKMINIDNVNSIKTGRLNYYPDNDGIPTIQFWFSENMNEEWAFDSDSERDSVLELITDNKNPSERG